MEITTLILHSSFSVGPLISLFAMAIACGNIKPCLAAFGGDQFRKDQVSPKTSLYLFLLILAPYRSLALVREGL